MLRKSIYTRIKFVFSWKTVKNQCSPLKVCGNGIQEQTAVCTKVYRYSDKKEESLPSKECRKAKIGNEPPAQVPCFVECTNMYWKYSDWTKVNSFSSYLI